MAQRRARRAGEEPARAGLGRGEVGWNGAGAGRAACATGPKMRRKAHEGEKLFFIYIFKNFLKASFQILF